LGVEIWKKKKKEEEKERVEPPKKNYKPFVPSLNLKKNKAKAVGFG